MADVGTVLVTGGCGYIGSHVTRQLSEAGYKVVVIDNLSTGFKEALIHGETLIEADLGDDGALKSVFKTKFDAILHFAASIVVPESVEKPLFYYRNNTLNTLKLVEKAVEHKVKHFVFSSTAAVYGDKVGSPVVEDLVVEPTNPYGRSKLADEWIIKDTAKATKLKYIILRYFNVAGANPKGLMGQRFPGATHLIKVANETALGIRKKLQVYGDDYDTVDGTGVRDYIHVEDLADAHLKGLKYLENGGESQLLNCGYGQGYSVKQVVEVVKKISGVDIAVEIVPRREGDIGELVARTDKIKRTLDWKPKYNDLNKIIKHAFEWEKLILRPR